ncbi:hypothetical protein N656DRAFT_785688 [Canariomyces notabilis]|uniref:Uncharacterized protein n=1 Tax=Canariomyces notabilis TaxID=2074819 RepID=A0AAN6QF64_9PEZI|nr:hypothetical protein N656DRAFT_785688 [Canariomyces arenarius]
MAESNDSHPIPDQLYHTTLTVVDYHLDTSGSTRDFYVLGTHTTVSAAKAFALGALKSLGYQPDDFADYTTRLDTPPESWTHGDGVMVYAKGAAGQELLVGLDTKPNTESLPAGPDDTPLLPEDADQLYYVLQNRTDYNQDKSGAYQTAEIEGCYAHREDAIAAAKGVLGMDREEFAQYDEREDVDDETDGWPFGDEVLVHAVAQTGENYTVAVKTVVGAHRKHGKA